MESIERLRGSLQLQRIVNNAERAGPKVTLTWMIFFGFVMYGIMEHSITVLLTSESVHQQSDVTGVRRYCDPPNMTAMFIYYDSSGELDETQFDMSQINEMPFKTKLTRPEYMELMLQSYFTWGTFTSPLFASMLARNVGPKRVYGYGVLGAGLVTLLVPAAWMTSAHYAIRFIQGMFLGSLMPCAVMLAVNWFPHHSRSGVLSWFSGIYVGYAICELLTSYVAESFGRDSIFYLTTGMIITWFVTWSLFVFNAPKKHPALIAELKKQAQLALARGTPQPRKPVENVPWSKILLSRPVWISVIAVFGTQWGQSAANISFLSYLKHVYYLSATTTSLLNIFSYSCHFLAALGFGYTIDILIRSEKVSITTARRMLVYISHFIPAGLMFVVGYVGCQPYAPAILYALAVIVSGAAYAGSYSNAIDVSPKYAGTIFGLCLTFGAVGKAGVSYLTIETFHGDVFGSWRMLFGLSYLIMFMAAVLFMLRSSGRPQPWDAATPPNYDMPPPPDSPPPVKQEQFIIKPKTNIETRILKAMMVQERDKFTRGRAYSASTSGCPRMVTRVICIKRASIS